MGLDLSLVCDFRGCPAVLADLPQNPVLLQSRMGQAGWVSLDVHGVAPKTFHFCPAHKPNLKPILGER